MKLHIDDDELASCVGCGLCLPHCPTYRVTGDEMRSPRGRIRLMREVHLEGRPADSRFVDAMETCVQCRGCETACPSAVPFGHLIDGARETLASTVDPPPAFLRAGLAVLAHRRALAAASRLAAAGQRLGLVPRRVGLPRLPLRQGRLRPSGTDVWLFTGCIMDAWQRDVHRSVQAVIETTGAGVALPLPGGACCGALSHHAGLSAQAGRHAESVMATMPGDAPILVDAAGCGAQLKDLGRVLGTPEAARFAARVLDVHEWLAARLDLLPAAPNGGRAAVAVQDPCHLRHVQHVEGAVRVVVGRYAEVVDLDDEGLCCGAGGAYAVLHPGLAGEIRDRKVASIERSGAPVTVSANPGCVLHLRGAGLDVRHPLEVVADALGLGASPRGH